MNQIMITLKSLFLLFLIMPLANLVHSQQAVSTSGADISGSGGSVAYTVGQPVYQTYYTISGSESQGVQQPIELFVYPGIYEQKVAESSTLVYPNPVSTSLTIDMSNQTASTHELILYDITGKVLFRVNTKEALYILDMSLFSRSVYILHVYSEGYPSDILRIVKN